METRTALSVSVLMVALSVSGQVSNNPQQTQTLSQTGTQPLPPLIAAPTAQIPPTRPPSYNQQRPLDMAHLLNNPGHPAFGDKGCLQSDIFAQTSHISGDDFVELHRIRCFSNCPLYTVRVYGDGRLVWHGDRAVSSMGDATANIDAVRAQALIANALKLGFGSLCDEYSMRALDGLASVTSLKIGGRVKTVADATPSNAPTWLYELHTQIGSLDAVQNLIGIKQTHTSNVTSEAQH